MTLDQAATGLAVRVEHAVGNPRPVGRRLAELGIRPGSVLRVLTRTSGGGAIVGIGDDRVAVSRDILRTVHVAPEKSRP